MSSAVTDIEDEVTKRTDITSPLIYIVMRGTGKEHGN